MVTSGSLDKCLHQIWDSWREYLLRSGSAGLWQIEGIWGEIRPNRRSLCQIGGIWRISALRTRASGRLLQNISPPQWFMHCHHCQHHHHHHHFQQNQQHQKWASNDLTFASFPSKVLRPRIYHHPLGRLQEHGSGWLVNRKLGAH